MPHIFIQAQRITHKTVQAQVLEYLSALISTQSNIFQFSPYLTHNGVVGFDNFLAFPLLMVFVAVVLDSQLNSCGCLDDENRATLLKAQPFLKTELGPARLYLV